MQKLLRDPVRVAGIPASGLAEFIRRYRQLHLSQRVKLLRKLSVDLGMSEGATQTVSGLHVLKLEGDFYSKCRQLRQELTPAYNRLLQRFINIPRGMHFAVQMRADLLASRHLDSPSSELLMELSGQLRDWFSVGLLRLDRLTLDSPASHLMKIMEYSRRYSPKPIDSWPTLQKRLGVGRRMYAYFHPAFPGEPLVYVEVALCRKGVVPESFLEIDEATQNRSGSTTAVFYAIASTQAGLRGLTLGEFLIKHVVDSLSGDREIRPERFVTLSPIPGLVGYLREKIRDGKLEENLSDDVVNFILEGSKSRDGSLWRKTLEKNRGPLMRLCARYLLIEKRKGTRTRDPVANFHLRNGARLLRLNWGADYELQRIRESLGMCVNYEYEADRLEENSHRYTLHGEIAADVSVQS
eukprot:CAMPEP_0198736354 /NCGR_PEP_ID=MMETSP1475-20131203/65237_1 /TAXON_ID= ORGANISM="Unidentified sp., Strain CCMP1999" /NCGR_SAMPLE_ID=MMETSP1475 /ASSEMBLY_ACC=CAM_ASM_001111 /LENGTH=409 /DNA_ID=CAMNT_0044500151 /DNA_START=129 /DNA_END=1355 /DNA_ORIENTATION=+